MSVRGAPAGALAPIAAAVALLAAAAIACSGGESPRVAPGPEAAPVLRVEHAVVKPGGSFRAWIVSAEPVSRGLDLELEVRRGASWERVATLVGARGDGEPSAALAGEPPLPVHSIAIGGDGPLRYAVPRVAPGAHRLTIRYVTGAAGPPEARLHARLLLV